MSILSDLKKDTNIQEDIDFTGYKALDSGVYDCTISLAYINTADSGAVGIVLHLITENQQEIKQTLWVRSGNAKGNKHYYTDKNGHKRYLPGFNQANAVAQLILNKDISDLDTDEKVIKIYSPSAQAEVPQPVQVLIELLNQKIQIGLVKEIRDKQAKDANGIYAPTGETREENTIDKIFSSPEGFTYTEKAAETEEANYINTWRNANKGVTKDKSSGMKAPKPKSASSNSPASSTLFDD